MLEVTRIKKTGKIVYPVGKQDSMHTLVLFPHETKTNRGDLGVVQAVRNENLKKDRETLL